MHDVFGVTVWAGFGVFSVVSLVVGIRLLVLWWRTGQLPELLIGLGVLGIGPVGFGIQTAAQLLAPVSPVASKGLGVVAALALGAGTYSQFLFSWRVYHGDEAWAARVAHTGLVLLLVAVTFEGFDTGFVVTGEMTRGMFLRNSLQVSCLLWASAEAFRYWRKMRRRMLLGLADPLVTNRFALWCLAAFMAGGGSALSIVVWVATGTPTAEMPWLTAVLSACGLTAAVAMYLAFMPPRFYRGWAALDEA